MSPRLPLSLVACLLAAAARAGAPAAPSFPAIDAGVSAVENGLRELQACAEGYQYLLAGAAAAERRVAELKNREQSSLADLPPLKRRMASDKLAYCVAQSRALSARAHETVLLIGDHNPGNAPGLNSRRTRISALQAQINGLVRKSLPLSDPDRKAPARPRSRAR